MKRTATVLFHRNYRGFQGGHLKLYDYINHTASTDWLRPQLFVDPSSRQDHIWADHHYLVDYYHPESADVLFVAGTDWRALLQHPGIEETKPVINLIQGFNHSVRTHELFSYLSKRAIRICVSREVADALISTRQCNGPVYTIPNCIDHSSLPGTNPMGRSVFIAGLKQPDCASLLSNRLARHSIEVDCLTTSLPRSEYLNRIADSYIAVTLPKRREGFYLPALEAMAMSVALVCPDCVGNRSFCLDDVTCVMPEMNVDSLEQAVLQLHADPPRVERLRANGLARSRLHSIEKERLMFLDLMRSIIDKLPD